MAAAATRERDKAVELTALRAKGALQAQFPAPTRRLFVKTITALTAKRLGQVLAKDFRQMFGPAYQAADLIGQLGDPMHPKKANALFYEFEETGMNRQLGYSSPADLINKYPAFFWNSV